ncbi:protein DETOXIFICATION 35 [Nicotiana tabacum]|uniref:Protein DETOXIFICATION n=2 Tax=Nicotiana TaxID=4085 RepID=A0A1S3XUE0_TOBAC|nr:PREDICTED: protein TRANSPARENT TESTA 12-like [Nicotiana sylvestris]XP_016443561.1 PREDICTED: protein DETOXIFICATION 35-like [Nicotiana tabacum]
MESPLLDDYSGDHHFQLIGPDGDYRRIRGLKEWWAVFWIESAKLWEIGGPIAFNIICQYGLYAITVAFCGHLGATELSAVSVAQTVIGIFAFGFMIGMGSALETLCGQAFGAGQVHMLGVYTQRSMIILLLSTFLLLPIYIFATPILKLLGQDHEIAVVAGRFAMLTIPELYSLSINIPTSKFLQAQSKVGVLAWIGFVALVVHALLLWLFIFVFNWGLAGAAISFNLVGWANAIAQFVYVVVWCKDGWKGWSWSAFSDIWAFVRLSIESAVMLCLETWYMMSIIILTGHLKDAVIAVGSLSICINVDGFEAMFFIGVNAAISVRVSNELGLGRARATKYSVYVTVFQSLLIGIVCMIVVLAVRNHLAILFTNSKVLQRAVADLAWLLGITMLLNSVQPVISGVAIGGGWQGLVAYINLGSYYVFGIPLGYVLGYVANLGVMGLWGGMIAGLALQTLLLSVVLYRIDWNKEVEQTTERMRKWGGQHIETEKTAGPQSPKGLRAKIYA